MKEYYQAIHPTWEGEFWLRPDGRFFGGGKNPHGEWKVDDGSLVLRWDHWKPEILSPRGDGWKGEYLELIPSQPLAPVQKIFFEMGLEVSPDVSDPGITPTDENSSGQMGLAMEKLEVLVRLCQKSGFGGSLGFCGLQKSHAQGRWLEELRARFNGFPLELEISGSLLTHENEVSLSRFERVIIVGKPAIDLSAAPNIRLRSPRPLLREGRGNWRCYQPCNRPCSEMMIDLEGNLRLCRTGSRKGNLIAPLLETPISDWERVLDRFTHFRLALQWGILDMLPGCLGCPPTLRR